MSRGPGKLQQQIIQSVGTTPVSLNQLCWELAEENGCVHRIDANPLPEGSIAGNFYKSFWRSVGLLKERDTLLFSTRSIETLPDLETLYPYRTQDLQVRVLRERLLPWTVEYLKQISPSYDVNQNEKFMLQRIPLEKRKQLSGTWRGLWSELALLMGQVPASRQRLVFNLMVKGEELAGSWVGFPFYQYSSSMEYLLEETKKLDGLPTQESALYERVLNFYVDGFPRSKRLVTRLKSRLASIVEMGSDKPRVQLGYYFKEAMLEAHKWIELLPGHKSPTEQFLEEMETTITDPIIGTATTDLIEENYADDGTWIDLSDPFPPNKITKYSPILDKLLLRDVFRPIEFAQAHF